MNVAHRQIRVQRGFNRDCISSKVMILTKKGAQVAPMCNRISLKHQPEEGNCG